MISNVYCNPRLSETYQTKQEAEDICNEMRSEYNNCTTLFDEYCDGEVYWICESPTVSQSSTGQGSCLYSTGIFN